MSGAATRRARAWITCAALGLVALGAAGCKKKVPAGEVSLPFHDDFERAGLGPRWTASGGQWEVRGGAVETTGANNAPLFLDVALPPDVVIEVDVESKTPLVDAKLELMTDGRTHQSGYIFILGGWSNKISTIARLDEHGADRKERSPTGVVGPKRYHWRIEKQGGALRWYIDDALYLSFDDPQPLDGPGHDRLAFSNWQNNLRYDDLHIWRFADAPPRGAARAPTPAVTSTTATTATAAGAPNAEMPR